jgi:hypothetical protein
MGRKNGTRKAIEGQAAFEAAQAPGSPALRVERRGEGSMEGGPQVRILLTSLPGGREDVDLTRSFTGGVAHALWMARGGDDTANWVEAERLVEQLFGPLAGRAERKAPARGESISGPLPDPGIPGLRRHMAKAP